MSTQHTPRPWHTNKELSRHNTALIYGPDGYLVADAGRIQKRGEKEVQANAALISAVPDMLEALEKIKELMTEKDGNKPSLNWKEVFNISESAIKKAQP